MPKSRLFSLLPLLAALGGPIALPAMAQVALTAESLTARSYESAPSWQERGFRPAGLVETVAMPGHVLVDLRAVFSGPWTDDLSRLSVNTRDIALVLPDGTERPVVGGYPTWGQLSLQGRSLSGRRPRDFPTDEGDIHWNGLFIVPKGTASATLRIEGDDATFEGAVAIPGPSAPDRAADFASFRAGNVRRFRTVRLEDGRGDDLVTSSITAPAGWVLAEIEVEVTGVASNQVDGDDRFTWHTHDFRLVDDRGQSMGLIGERFIRRLLDSQYNGTDVGASTERTMIWVVPEGLAEARLLYGETEVARVNLGSAAITPTD
ncbi:MAG: hypothetical protein Kow0013_26650 [Pararhodobacter sp.]